MTLGRRMPALAPLKRARGSMSKQCAELSIPDMAGQCWNRNIRFLVVGGDVWKQKMLYLGFRPERAVLFSGGAVECLLKTPFSHAYASQVVHERGRTSVEYEQTQSDSVTLLFFAAHPLLT